MSTERTKQDIKYVKNMLKFAKRYVTAEVKAKTIHRDTYTKISIGHRITIQKTDGANFFYFFFLGNQIFNLYKDEILLNGGIKFRYKELQEKDAYFNAMVNDELYSFNMQDFNDMEYIYKRLNEMI